MTERFKNKKQETLHWSDDRLIDHEIASAASEERAIVDAAARMIASQWHGGQASELHTFSSSGAINLDPLVSEVVGNIRDTEDTQQRDRLNQLAQYVIAQKDRGRQEGWSKLWLQPPEGMSGREDDDESCSACGQHISSPHSPDCPLNDDEPVVTPYSAYTELFGDGPELADEFEQRYYGAFGDLAAYAEHILGEAGSLRALHEAPIPEDLRPYISVDYAAIGETWEVRGDIVTAETDDGRIYVFNKRA